jgi:4-hydroxy-tetrahydrodipicolinate reductase
VTVKLVVSGATGRMGRAVAALAGAEEHVTLLGGIAPREPGVDPGSGGYPTLVDLEDAGALIDASQVLIDFSAPDYLARLLGLHGDRLGGRALVVGTTGLDSECRRLLEEAQTRTAVLTAANFSVGVNLLVRLARIAARVLDAQDFDVEIVEAHHGRKEDAPSGTALALGEAVAEGRGAALAALRRDGRSGRSGPRPSGEIGMHALRGGGVAGEHIVHFLGEREQIRLGHTAAGRDLFAEGALRAARWLAGREPGGYTMAQVLDLED